MEKLNEELIILILGIIASIGASIPYIIKGLKSIYDAWFNKKVRNLNKTKYDLKNHILFSNIYKYKKQKLETLDIKDQLIRNLIYEYECIHLLIIDQTCREIVNMIQDGLFKDKSLYETYNIILNIILEKLDNSIPEDYPKEIYKKIDRKLSVRKEILYAGLEKIWFSPVYDNYQERYYAVLDLIDCMFYNRLESIYKIIIDFNGDLKDLEYKGFKKDDYE